MSYKVKYPPLLPVHTPLPQLCHKVCDVVYTSSMKGQTLLSRTDYEPLCGSPHDSDPSLKDHPLLQGVEETIGMERLLKKCKIKNQLMRECMAECLGVYVLIVSIICGFELQLVNETLWYR